MAKKISSRDLFEQEDLFRGVRDSADQTIKKLTELKDGMVASAKEMKNAFSGIKLDNIKDLEKFVQLAEKSNKITQQSLQIDKQKKIANDQKKQSEIQLLKIEQEKEKLKQQQMRTDKMVTQEQERQTRQAEKQKKLAADQANAYKKLEKNTRELKNESKRLGAEMLALEQSGRKNSAEYRKLATQYKQVTKAAQQGDVQLKKLDKTVGDNFRNVGNYKSALGGLTTALGSLGVAFGAGAILRSTFGIIKNFDQAQADLAAISGKSKDELAGLTAQAKELGATTQFSATQITQMQTELAKLGFSTEQISASTEAVSNFAAATGADIPRAAALAGSALRAFNLPASEMERVVSTLGVSTTKSALDFSKLESSLSTVAPVAASFGFSIEDTTALLGTLSNAGFDASSAATATRNILLNLADSSGDLAQELGRPITSADDLAAGLKELEARGVDLATALELTDKRSVAAFSTFMKNADSITELKDGITDVNDELEAMAKKRLDSVSGQLTLLQSAWEGFILGTNDSTGASDKLKAAIGFLAENLSTIMSIVIKLTRFWVIYKTTTFAVNQVNKIAAINFKAIGRNIAVLIPGTKAYTANMRLMSIQTKGMNAATKAATISMKSLGKVMKATPWGLVVGAAAELYFWLSDTEDATDELTESQQQAAQAAEELAQAQDRERQMVADATGEFVGLVNQLGATNANSKERIDLINQINNQYGTTLQNLQDETAFQAQLNQAVADYITFQKLRIKQDISKEKTTKLIKAQIEAQERLNKTGLFATDEELRKAEEITSKYFGDARRIEQELSKISPLYKKFMQDVNDTIDTSYQNIIQSGGNFMGDLADLLPPDLKQKYDELGASIKDIGDAQFFLNQEGFTQIDLQKEISKYKYKTPSAGISNYNKNAKGATSTQKQLNTEFKDTNVYLSRQRELLFELSEIQRESKIEEKERAIKSEFATQIENIKKVGKFDATELNKLIKEKADLEAEAIRKKRDFETESLDLKYKEERKKRYDDLEDEKKSLEEGVKNSTASAKEKQDALKEIDDNYKLKEKELIAEDLKRYQDLESEKKNIVEKATNDIEDLNRRKIADIAQNEKKLKDDIIKYQDEQTKNALDNAKKQKEKDKEMYEAKREFAKLTADYAIKQSEKVISQIDKEIAAAEKQADTLRELAKEGNINAQDSLAEQERLIAESTKRKEKELKRQQRIRLAQSIYETYSKNLESLQPGEKTTKALADTIRDTTLLQAFINSLPGFEKGTEDTGKDGRGVDGKGGMLSVLHPNERVIPKSMNEQLNGMSNEELTRIATEYQNGKLFNGKTTNDALNFALLVNELQDLKKVIKDKPETNVALGEITQSAMEIVQRTKKGNSIVYNRFKVK